MIWGTLMVIPIEESLIYVRPLYLRAQGGRIPELTRVIVAYEDRIVMEQTLEAVAGAAVRRPGTGVVRRTPRPRAPRPRRRRRRRRGPPPPPPAGDLRELAAEARAHYDRAIAAQRAGDWARYGEEIGCWAKCSSGCER